MDGVYDRLDDDLELQARKKADDNCDGQVRKFYADKTLLLTGCTGYVGISILEKLLRTCTDVKKIYIIIREKNGLSVEERLRKCFENVLFEKVRMMNPEFAKNVVPIRGDLTKDGLGLLPDDRKTLIENVDIIMHNGASVYFEGNISTVLRSNVLGTQEMIELASNCTRLRAFLYCSSAYSHCYKNSIQEEYYEQPIDLEVVRDVIKVNETIKNGITQKSLRTLLGPWPNIYILSKAVAENLVEDFSKKAECPVAIFRPSIVTSTYTEPIAGWCANKNGPVSMVAAILLGFVHVLYWKKDSIVDFIPSDMTANASLIAVWDLAVHKKPKEKHVYNYGSGTLRPLYINKFAELSKKFGASCPSMKAFWYPFTHVVHNLYLFHVLNFYLHIIPMCITDFTMWIAGKKAFILRTTLRYWSHFEALMWFGTGGFQIEVKQMLNAWDLMNPIDRKEFSCDVRTINWEEYLLMYWRGIRIYILNDPVNTIPLAKARTRKLCVINCFAMLILVVLSTFIFLYFMYSVGSYVLNF